MRQFRDGVNREELGSDLANAGHPRRNLDERKGLPPPPAPTGHDLRHKRTAVKAVVFHGIGDIGLEDVNEPKIKEPNDVIVALTTSAICGTDLHMIVELCQERRRGRYSATKAWG